MPGNGAFLSHLDTLKETSMSIPTTLEQFIAQVKELHTSNLQTTYTDFLTDGCEEDLPENVKNVLLGADTFLITEAGKPNWKNIDALENEVPGVRVTAGERDSFGWLTGVIHTQHGKVVYG